MRLPSLGIRGRTTLIATAMVAVVMLIASVILVVTLTNSLRAAIRTAADTRAADVALLARTTPLPAFLPGRGDSLLVQVVSAAGRVIASSRDLASVPPISKSAPGVGKTVVNMVPSIAGLDAGNAGIGLQPGARYLVVARGVQMRTGRATVYVASSLSPLNTTVGALVPILVFGTPFVLALVAAITWVLTGLALQPVRAIRRRAETISSSAPGERLPVPAARDEIHDLAETMNRMLERIEAAGMAQRQFTSDASHELKSPIAAMRTMLEVARRDPRSEDDRSLIDDLLAEDRRLELLVADLLLLGRGDEDRIKLELTEWDLAPIVAEEIDSVARRAGLEIVSEIEGPVHIVADKARIRQLLRNLLDNGVRHAMTSVWVETLAEYGDAVIRVSDDGPGVPREDRERIFERFVRLDEGRGRAEGGTGLGLPVCRAIASAHGGQIRVVESTHGGATFEVRLPLEPAES